MINTYKIPGAVKLFRYDIECPPDNWNTDFKNKEYVYSDDCEDLRIKNRIGAFYFFENKATAYSTGCLAAQNNGCNKIWLTETSIIQKFNYWIYPNLRISHPYSCPLMNSDLIY